MATESRRDPRASATASGARRTTGSSAGQGTYIDDMQLPGMLYMAILRSPYAHAKLNGIDTSRAPGARRA